MIIERYAWMAAVGALVLTNLLTWGKLKTSESARLKLDHDFTSYKLVVTEKARVAEAARRQVELEGFRNAEKVTSNQARIEAERTTRDAALARTVGGLRTDAERWRAHVVGLARSGDTAAVAAEAAIAGELFDSCADRYSAMARQAEQDRVQAVGLWEYVRGNPMCSQPFEQP